MKTRKTSGKVAYAGIFTAIAASLCCITPVLALIAGAGGIASTFSWIEPIRPYLIGITILVLAFAWYQKLKPESQQEIDCACEEEENPSFWQSKKFLFLITLFAGIMLAFPYYAHNFYGQSKKEIVYVSQSNIVKHTFDMEGMTCSGCEAHVEHEVSKLDGILSVKASYKRSNTLVEFDKTKVDVSAIGRAINSAGYKVIDKQNKEEE